MGLNHNPFWDKLAVDSYKHILKNKTRNPLFYNNLGLAHLRLNNEKKAIAAFRKAIQCDKAFLDAYYHLATTFKSSGQPGAAKKHYAQYQKLCNALGKDSLVVKEQIERLVS